MRLLLIEDEAKLAKSLAQILRNSGYATDFCLDGRQGYEQAAVESYDLILLDINLPSMSGSEICTALRQEGVDTPILMVTAKDQIIDKIDNLDRGADDYLVKPFDVEELLARIRSLLRRGRSQPAVLQVGPITLNPATRQVHRDESLIQLSAKEYSLLEFLLRHPNHVLSKQQILEHVWGDQVDPFSNVVDVYIGYLRQKIDKPFAGPPLITTIKGLGYKIHD